MAFISKALLALFAILGAASATSFNVVNSCGSSINVVVRENSGVPSIGTSGFSLSQGASQPLSPPDGWSGNIGTGTPGLLAEFTINSNGQDFYDLSAVDGFFIGIGMNINGVSCSAAGSICPPENTSGGTCTNPNRDDANTQYAQNVRASCPNAYSWSGDNSKTFATGTGGTFTIAFCG